MKWAGGLIYGAITAILWSFTLLVLPLGTSDVDVVIFVTVVAMFAYWSGFAASTNQNKHLCSKDMDKQCVNCYAGKCDNCTYCVRGELT